MDHESSYDQIMLTDSVLSIIQNYYVDHERIDNSKLVLKTIKTLQSGGYISFEESENLISLSSLSKSYSFHIDDIKKYNKILEVFLVLGILVDEYLANDVPERGGRESVGNEVSRNERSGLFVVLSNLVHSLDAHSALLSTSVYRELKEGTEGKFGGLGILVGVKDSILTILQPIKGSPAFKAGIKNNDKIIAIDGRSTFGYSLDELVQFMRGAPGTHVKLSLLREGAMFIKDVEIKREIVEVESTTYQEIRDNNSTILVVKIESFSQSTTSEVKEIIDDFTSKNKNFSGIILDLRSNPGGLLNQAVGVSDLFLQEEGVIVSTKGRRNDTEYSSKNGFDFDFPMVVLLNSDSASASEIVAGALKDRERAIIIGQPSFGKGSVQTIFELPNEQALKLTISRYYTPNDISIQNKGIIPDVWLQPVELKDQNLNLMGNNRYRQERFLENRLSEVDLGVKNSVPSYYKGYFLVEKANLDPGLEIAKKLFSSFQQSRHFLKKHNLDRFNAKLALFKESKSVTDVLSKYSNFVSNRINAKFRIDWHDHGVSKSEKLDISIEKIDKGNLYLNKKNPIIVSIRNNSSSKVSRVSLFAKAIDKNINTFETLVGKLDGFEEKNIALNIDLSERFFDDSSKLKFEFGIAVEGRPSSDVLKIFEFDILKRELTKLLVGEIGIVKELGSLNHKLDPREEINLNIPISNRGSIGAENVVVKIFNLSGHQMILKKFETSLNKIDAYSKYNVPVSLQGNDEIVNSNVRLGVEIKSASIPYVIRKELKLATNPNKSKGD